MSKIIERVDSYVTTKSFCITECSNCGWQGTPENNNKCNKCSGKIRSRTITASHTIPGYIVVECYCGEIINCYGFTNSCECGREYNWSGQELAHRRFWGEETGESYSDIVMAIDGEMD